MSNFDKSKEFDGVGDVYYYDETSPSCLRWKINIYGGKKYLTLCKKAGDSVGHLNKLGYYEVRFNGRNVMAHRVILKLFNIDITDFQIDHVDGNRSNNKIHNLRSVSQVENSRNQKKSKRNTSGVVGVNLTTGYSNGQDYEVWQARYSDENKARHCRVFSVNKYGFDKAFELAVAWRNSKISEVNERLSSTKELGYSERHGV